jgi:hypothetical protein
MEFKIKEIISILIITFITLIFWVRDRKNK